MKKLGYLVSQTESVNISNQVNDISSNVLAQLTSHSGVDTLASNMGGNNLKL